MFALLPSERIVDYPVFVVFDLFPWPGGPGGEITKKGRAFYQALRGKTEIPFEKLPMLVRFRDINDPMTVELVEPKNLTKSFGSGVRLAHASLEMTRDPVTSKIDTELMWLEKSAGAVTGKTVFDAENPGPENYVTRLNFKRGIVK